MTKQTTKQKMDGILSRLRTNAAAYAGGKPGGADLIAERSALKSEFDLSVEVAAQEAHDSKMAELRDLAREYADIPRQRADYQEQLARIDAELRQLKAQRIALENEQRQIFSNQHNLGKKHIALETEAAALQIDLADESTFQLPATNAAAEARRKLRADVELL